MKKELLIILLVIISVLTTARSQGRDEIVKWLQERAYDLQTSNPNYPINNPSLDSVFKNVTLVLAGEANHGSKEFAQVRHRLFRHLVENLGFTYFLIEADFAAGLAVDDYLCSDTGNPIDALGGLISRYVVNKEVLELIEWMNTYNKGRRGKDQIRFFGIDAQRSEAAWQRLKLFFSVVDLPFYKQISSLTLAYEHPNHPVGTLEEKYGPRILPRDTIEILRAQLIKNRVQYERVSSKMEYKIALRLVEALAQSNKINHSTNGFETRENLMAENVDWILNEIDPREEKAFLWAHNTHVSYSKTN